MNKATPIKINTEIKSEYKYKVHREKEEIMNAIMTIGNNYYLTLSFNNQISLLPIDNVLSFFELASYSIICVKIADGVATFCQPSPRRTTTTYAQMENDGREAFKNVFGFYPDDDIKVAMDRLLKK